MFGVHNGAGAIVCTLGEVASALFRLNRCEATVVRNILVVVIVDILNETIESLQDLSW